MGKARASKEAVTVTAEQLAQIGLSEDRRLLALSAI